MVVDLGRLMRLWSGPIPEGAGVEAGFRELYTDPVSVNGVTHTVSDLVDQARALQGVFEAVEREILDVVEGPGRVAVAFVVRGRQVGPLPTPLGTLAPTGRLVEMRVIDILRIEDGLIRDVWMVSDNLDLLMQLDAVALVGSSPGPRA